MRSSEPSGELATIGPTGAEIWQAAVAGSGLGIWEWRVEEGPPSFSPRCAEILGYSSFPALRDTQEWLDMIHPEDRARARKDLESALRGDTSGYTSEHRRLCGDGSWKWVLVRGSVTRRRGSRALQMVGTVADVSERHAYISALRSAEEASRRAFDDLRAYLEAINQHALVSVTDIHGTIIEVNGRFCEVSGYVKEELVGSNHRILNSGYHAIEFFEQLWHTISQGRVWHGEICNRARDGRLYWVDSAIVPQLDASGLPARYISVRIEITQRKSNEQRIEYMATHDMLTDLPNRNLIQDRIQHAIVRARRRGEKFAVLFIDLDGFKDVNDTQGHAAGDALLKSVGRRMKSLLRAEDTLGRLGGDEFIALLTDLKTGEEAGQIADKLLQSLSRPFVVGEKELRVGASIGVAIFPDDGEDAAALFKHGDIAMYQVKETGRNGYQFFTPAMQQRVLDRQESRQLLHHALRSGELLLSYQPVFDSVGSVVCVDAQVTWQHPRSGMLTPEALLAVAQEFGGAVELGNWTLHAVCRRLRQWANEGTDVPARTIISVPLKLLGQAHFVEGVASVLHAHRIAPDRIGFCIPHHGLDSDAWIASLTQLRKSGHALYLGGFGTGHCNLADLQKLPLTAIKLDRSFVAVIAKGPQMRGVVKAIVDLIHALGFSAIADGVDTDEQKALLLALGCDAFQGNRWCPPIVDGESLSPRIAAARGLP